MTKPNSNNSNDDRMEALFQEMRQLPPDESGKETVGCQPFPEGTIEGWYGARNFVLGKLNAEEAWGAGGIAPSSKDHVHVVIHYKDNPMALYVARQVALVAHFPNFVEGDGKDRKPKNRTVITILYNQQEHPDILGTLKRQECLCNLTDVCECVVKGGGKEKVINRNSYIDILLELIGFDHDQDIDDYTPQEDHSNRLPPVVIKDEELNRIDNGHHPQRIDVGSARRVNMVYKVGADINNLPPDDPNTAERYSKALLYFCYQQTPTDTMDKWSELCWGRGVDSWAYQIDLRNKLSNVFCADCFATRLKSVCSNFEDLLEKDEQQVLDKVKTNLQVLAQCEHARWNVEKLILGFSTFTPKEQWTDAQRFGSARNDYRKQLKNKAHHIDLRSYHDLQRTDPGNMKYDCFLMMAMVRIMKENQKQ